MKILKTDMYLLLINEEAEIKELIDIGDYFLGKDLSGDYNFVGKCFEKSYNHSSYYCWTENKSEGGFGLKYKIIAYYPLTKEAKELDLPLLPEFKHEVNIEKLAEENNRLIGIYKNDTGLAKSVYTSAIKNFKDGYRAAQAKGQYSLEDMKKAFEKGHDSARKKSSYKSNGTYKEDLEECIQSLSTQQLPKEFIPEYEDIHIPDSIATEYYFDSSFFNKKLKTITNSEEKIELIGTYKY